MSRNVTYVKPKEPSFLKTFKAQVGYREPISVEAKREIPSRPDDDGEEAEREDEQPTVVVLRKGDLGQAEFEASRRKSKASGKEGSGSDLEPDCDVGIPTVPPRPRPTADDDNGDEERIKFRKPAKRRSSDGVCGGVLDASSSKRTRTDKSQKVSAAAVVVGGAKRRSSLGGESKSRKIKNSSLLSFGGDEEDS